MTIHVTISEAQTRLAELVAAALRGEEVLVAETGAAPVRLVPIPAETIAERAGAAHGRMAAFGMYRHLVDDPDVVVPPSMTDDEVDERWRRKFGPAA